MLIVFFTKSSFSYINLAILSLFFAYRLSCLLLHQNLNSKKLIQAIWSLDSSDCHVARNKTTKILESKAIFCRRSNHDKIWILNSRLKTEFKF